MTQLYVGNLNTDTDEKTVRAVFGKYGLIRDTVMKNGYAFLTFDNHLSADAAVKEMNGTDLLGSHIIVELSHQQRTTRKKAVSGKVEVTSIPEYMNWQAVETLLGSVGTVIKSLPDDNFDPPTRGVVVFESVEQAQRAANTFTGDEHSPKVVYVEETRRPSSASAALKINGTRTPMSPTGNGPISPLRTTSDFPLRILVPNEMVGAIIGKEGSTIRNITQITKARVDVHRKENTNSNEKAITIIGSPECCTEAAHLIMKIMQRELLLTSGLLENGQPPPDPLPCVPLKLLAHNELIGRVIGKQGATLKRIMAESNTKITISKIKDLTPYNMERTITVLGTVDNCKKAESLISTKLRTSFESDMAHLIPTAQANSQSTSSTPPFSSPSPDSQLAASIPTSPSSSYPATFYSSAKGKYEFVTTSTNSCGALEMNGLSGFGHQLHKANPSRSLEGSLSSDPFVGDVMQPPHQSLTDQDSSSDLIDGIANMLSSVDINGADDAGKNDGEAPLSLSGSGIWGDNGLLSPVMANTNGCNNVSYGWGSQPPSTQPWVDQTRSNGYIGAVMYSNQPPTTFSESGNFFSDSHVVNTSAFPYSPNMTINSPTPTANTKPTMVGSKFSETFYKVSDDVFASEAQWSGGINRSKNVFSFDEHAQFGMDQMLQASPFH